MRVTKVGVVGAGAMGSGIAALAASAGLPVVLLDVPGNPDRNAPAREGLARALKARPGAFMDPDRAALVRVGNIEDDLELLAECDWIVEAIIELPEPKQLLFSRLEPLLKPHAIVSSNTSGIPMRILTHGRTEAFRRRFVGTHFFNPVRYMHLLEVIPTSETHAEVIHAIRDFSERALGKGIVIAKDAPGFIANRLGIYGMIRTMHLMMEHDLTIDEVDTLTGPLIGRPKSATFRTADISGLDVIAHVATGLSQTTGERFTLPDWVVSMVKEKCLGDKTSGGFYRKQGKDIFTRDWKTGQYVPQQKVETPELAAISRKSLQERLRAIRDLPGKYGDFLRALHVDLSRYVLMHTPELAYDIVSVDHAMEWGYGWEAGPFRVMDAIGLDWVRAEIEKRDGILPSLIEKAQGTFYKDDGESELQLAFDGRYVPVEETAGRISLARLARAGRVIEQSDDAALLDLGDGVALFEFRSKMNTLGEGVIAALGRAMARVERDGMAGLVIGNDDPRTFTAGANLAGVAQLAAAGDFKRLEQGAREFQDAVMSLRRVPFPVVVAPFGLTLGGGAEFTLHATRVQAHAELYMGLVEVGVGILPAGGGTKELLFRFTGELAPYPEADPFEGIKRAFQHIALAKTSTSALDARRMGFLREADRITMNRDLLIADAKRRVLDLAPDYVAPVPRTIRAMGKEAIGNLFYALWSFKEAGSATDHDVCIGRHIAYVLCGGDGPARTVTEQDILDLEREALLSLLGTKATQDRMQYMLKTGKPLRN